MWLCWAGAPTYSALMGSSCCDRSCTLRPPGRYCTEGTTGDPHCQGGGQGCSVPPFIATPMCPQNLVLPDTFFSFYDLRREFHVQHPSARPAKDLTVATMAQGICDQAG